MMNTAQHTSYSQHSDMPPSVHVFGLPIHAGSFQTMIDLLAHWSAESVTRSVSFCPVYTVMRALEDPHIHRALESADLRAADGMPVVWLQRWRGISDAERIYGPDVMRAVCEATQDRGIRHYFLGSTAETLHALETVLRANYPQLHIVGRSTPRISIPPTLDEDLLHELWECRPQVVWIALGSPKQDLWMEFMKPHMPACLMLGVGAAFDFIAGTKPQAPAWMRHSGLEWLFRLINEPRRLWRRYLVYNTRFLYRLFTGNK